MEPLVSIIILNFNGEALLPTPIESIARIRYPKARIETIVVDNGSKDGSLAYLKKQRGVRVVKLPTNEGYSAMNAGIKVAKGTFLFLVNNDLAFHPDCVRELVDAYGKVPKPGLFAPIMVDPAKRWLTTRYLSRSFYAGGRKVRFKKPKQNIVEASFVGIVFFHREMVKELGQVWDPDYFLYAEDIDIMYRTQIRGRSVVWVNNAIVYHSWEGTITKYFNQPRRAYFAEKNLLMTFLKNADTRSLLLYTPYVIFMRVVSLLRQLFTLQFSLVWAKLRAYWWNLAHLGLIMRKRKKIQARRLVADKTFLPRICNEKKFILEQLGR